MVQLTQAAAALLALLQAVPGQSLSGAALQADVETYVGHGDHLLGQPGAARTADWLQQRLSALGYETGRQDFEVRQFQLREVALEAAGRQLPVALQWWPAVGASQRTVAARIGNGAGQIALLPVDVKDQSYLSPELEARVRAAAADGASAVLLQTRTSLGADGPFLFNARQGGSPWPVPVLAIGEADGQRLAAEAGPVRITVDGSYGMAGAANIVARLDRPGSDRVLVVSTPYTGWGPCGGERGPGIALFLALADWARAAVPHDVVLVATAGHEIGHSGMARFLASDAAPTAAGTILWLHLGASIATFASPGSTLPNSRTRYVLFSAPLFNAVLPAFADSFVPVDTARAAFGEVADVKKSGYPRHLGFAGYGPHHHLPSDTAASTGPEILEDAGRRILSTLANLLSTEPAQTRD